ncbi:MAG: peptidase M23, partial [Bacteroidia bacterium]|nr:peptidase M23 [Bacteroidia bacterium]
MNTHRSKVFRLAICMFCMFIAFSAVAQKQNGNPKASELRDKKKKLNKDIENLNSILDETTTGKKLTMFQVQAINMKISARQELINTINSEIRLMNGQISKKQKEIERKNAELDTLKNRYKKMVYYAYRNKQAYNKIMFVFASDDFNQAYGRVKYMQEINVKRHSHADSIVKKQTLLTEEQKDLQGKISEKKSLLGSEETEKISLAKEKTEQEEMLGKLSSKEKQ